MKFSMTCTCGDVMPMDAANREEAVSKMKAMMTADMIAKHMKEKHPSEAVPPVAEVHAMIEQKMMPA